MDVLFILFGTAAIAVVCFIIVLGAIFLSPYIQPFANIIRYESEKYFITNVHTNDEEKFPDISSPPSIHLSIIIPAYNEELRLPSMLSDTFEYLKDSKWTYEIIIVDDGSIDNTTKIALSYTNKHGSDIVRVLTLEKNRGKGGAVRLGMLSARGKYLLFADADGATKFADIEYLFQRISALTNDQDIPAIVCGSRAHLEEDSIAKRSFFRTILMKGFHFLVWFFCVKTVKDTQCGFKLLTRSAASFIFNNIHVERWAFDVEMLYIAEMYNMSIQECPVHWTEIDGSKIVPIFSWLQMGQDLLLIKIKYLVGMWQIRSKTI